MGTVTEWSMMPIPVAEFRVQRPPTCHWLITPLPHSEPFLGSHGSQDKAGGGEWGGPSLAIQGSSPAGSFLTSSRILTPSLYSSEIHRQVLPLAAMPWPMLFFLPGNSLLSFPLLCSDACSHPCRLSACSAGRPSPSKRPPLPHTVLGLTACGSFLSPGL